MKNPTEEPVYFYSTKGEFGCFSNFYRESLEFAGRVWKSSEHAYQAMKFRYTDKEQFEKIFEARTPREAADLGRDRSHRIHSNWEQIKYRLMKAVVKAKFIQHQELRHTLLSTGQRHIAEHCRDKIWGDNLDGSGTNWLGKILMEVRDELNPRHDH